MDHEKLRRALGTAGYQKFQNRLHLDRCFAITVLNCVRCQRPVTRSI